MQETVVLPSSLELIIDKSGATDEKDIALIFVPGFGTIEKSRRHFFGIIEKLRSDGISITGITFRYRSHDGRVIKNNNGDAQDLDGCINYVKLELGYDLKDIGICGVCYGGNLAARALAEHPGLGFGVLLQPYLGGMKSFKGIGRLLYTLATDVLDFVSIKKIPIGKRYGGMGYLEVRDILAISKQDISALASSIPQPVLYVMADDGIFSQHNLRRFYSRLSSRQKRGYSFNKKHLGKYPYISRTVFERFADILGRFIEDINMRAYAETKVSR